MSYVEFRSAAVETLAVGLPEEDEAGKEDDAVCNRAKGVSEGIVGKKMRR